MSRLAEWFKSFSLLLPGRRARYARVVELQVAQQVFRAAQELPGQRAARLLGTAIYLGLVYRDLPPSFQDHLTDLLTRAFKALLIEVAQEQKAAALPPPPPGAKGALN